IPNNKIVAIKIKYGEVDLGMRVKSFGGKWDRQAKVWRLPYEAVKALGLEERIIPEKNLQDVR
ncbi:MAG: hypothetical protein ACTSPQ_14850, partial [Candidatus Helarchaeota archaeon]